MHVSRRWDRAHLCANNSAAVASGCVSVSPAGAALPDLRSRSADPSGRFAPGESPFVLLAIHAVMPNGWVVWEEGKYVSVSRRRFRSVEEVGGGASLRVTVGGAPGEVVELTALRPTTGGLAGPGLHPGSHRGLEWTVHSVKATVGAGAVVTVGIAE